jgi:hypothetical protein
MHNIRKPNRNSAPVRVTQRGTRTRYPQPNHRAAAAKRSRWAGTGIRRASKEG